MILVAEIGSNHKGIPALAFEMLRQAKLAGADIAKFQFGHARGHDDTAQDMRRWATDYAVQLQGWCNYLDIELMASIFSQEGLDVARQVGMKRYKIAYGTATNNAALCEAILADNRETFVSGYKQLLASAKREHASPWPCARPIWVLSEYPAYPWRLKEMPQYFDDQGYYGYSDHTPGIEGCLLAISRGAQYVEKHFTLDKTENSIKDHPFSATPEEFADLARLGKPLSRIVNG